MNIVKMMKTSILMIGLSLIAFSATAQCHNNSKSWKTSYNKKHKKASDIVSLASGSKTLKTLVAAVSAADLVETLQSDGPFTVFAPNDAAFAALPEGTVENLLKPENKGDLIKVLTYHVVPGRIESTDLRNGQRVKTVAGGKVNIATNSSIVKINDAIVQKANVRASNGVVHIIDRVLLPSG